MRDANTSPACCLASPSSPHHHHHYCRVTAATRGLWADAGRSSYGPTLEVQACTAPTRLSPTWPYGGADTGVASSPRLLLSSTSPAVQSTRETPSAGRGPAAASVSARVPAAPALLGPHRPPHDAASSAPASGIGAHHQQRARPVRCCLSFHSLSHPSSPSVPSAVSLVHQPPRLRLHSPVYSSNVSQTRRSRLPRALKVPRTSLQVAVARGLRRALAANRRAGRRDTVQLRDGAVACEPSRGGDARHARGLWWILCCPASPAETAVAGDAGLVKLRVAGRV